MCACNGALSQVNDSNAAGPRFWAGLRRFLCSAQVFRRRSTTVMSQVPVFGLACDVFCVLRRFSVAGRPIFEDLQRYESSPATVRILTCDETPRHLQRNTSSHATKLTATSNEPHPHLQRYGAPPATNLTITCNGTEPHLHPHFHIACGGTAHHLCRNAMRCAREDGNG